MTQQVERIRRDFEIPPGMTDDQINQALVESNELLSARIVLVTANTIEQREMAEQAMKNSGKEWKDLKISDWEASARDITEWLFRLGFYGPSCVWARALLEYMLQDDVILNEARSEKLASLKLKIESPGPNPRIDEMFKELKAVGVWLEADTSAFGKIKDNGDWVVHHRYDKTTGGAMASKYEWGFSKIARGVDGYEIVGPATRRTLEFNRTREERRLAKESLALLYELIIKRRST